MAIQVNIHEAKTQLSKLLAAVEDGEEVILARGGRPVARLVPYRKDRQIKGLGGYQGIWIAEDFDAPLPEFEDEFYK